MTISDTSAVAIEAVRRLSPKGGAIAAPWKLAGGAVHDTWAVDAAGDDGPRKLVVRVSPAGRSDFTKTQREFEVLRVAHARGVRCPEPITLGTCDTGEDFLVMARVEGDANPRQLVTSDAYEAARTAIIPRLAEDLVLIHRITPADVSGAPGMAGPEPGEDPLRFQRRLVEERYRVDLLNPHPVVEWAFRWLDRRIAELAPAERPPCVVHGDYRVGNMLYDEQGLTAVLDWEGTHISEPEEDLTWFCTRVWRFARPDREAGGVTSREEWVLAYERASGRSIDRARVAAWEVLQNIRWCQITMMQARVHLDGGNRSHELAAIGRRTGETELEILRLTGVTRRFSDAG